MRRGTRSCCWTTRRCRMWWGSAWCTCRARRWRRSCSKVGRRARRRRHSQGGVHLCVCVIPRSPLLAPAELDATQARIRELEGEVRDVKARMQELKTALYAKVKRGPWGAAGAGGAWHHLRSGRLHTWYPE